MAKEFKLVIWRKNDKSSVLAKLYEDGKFITNVTLNRPQENEMNSDWDTLMSQFSEEDIDKNTQRYDDEQIIKEKTKRKEEEKSEILKNLFTAKLEAFEITEVQNSKNRKMRSRIRKAQSLTEVYAVTAALLMSEIDSETPSE